jgi:hypothetical protein
MSRPQDALDITDRALTDGWTLPPGWRVYAWTEHDGDMGDPRDKGEVYNTDVEEADYNNPARGFCKHCGQPLTARSSAPTTSKGRTSWTNRLPCGGGGRTAGRSSPWSCRSRTPTAATGASRR